MMRQMDEKRINRETETAPPVFRLLITSAIFGVMGLLFGAYVSALFYQIGAVDHKNTYMLISMHNEFAAFEHKYSYVLAIGKILSSSPVLYSVLYMTVIIIFYLVGVCIINPDFLKAYKREKAKAIIAFAMSVFGFLGLSFGCFVLGSNGFTENISFSLFMVAVIYLSCVVIIMAIGPDVVLSYYDKGVRNYKNAVRKSFIMTAVLLISLLFISEMYSAVMNNIFTIGFAGDPSGLGWMRLFKYFLMSGLFSGAVFGAAMYVFSGKKNAVFNYVLLAGILFMSVNSNIHQTAYLNSGLLGSVSKLSDAVDFEKGKAEPASVYMLDSKGFVKRKIPENFKYMYSLYEAGEGDVSEINIQKADAFVKKTKFNKFTIVAQDLKCFIALNLFELEKYREYQLENVLNRGSIIGAMLLMGNIRGSISDDRALAILDKLSDEKTFKYGYMLYHRFSKIYASLGKKERAEYFYKKALELGYIERKNDTFRPDNYDYTSDGTASGSLSGDLPSGVKVAILRIDNAEKVMKKSKDALRPYELVRVKAVRNPDQDGKFRFDKMVSGWYQIVVYIRGSEKHSISAKAPFYIGKDSKTVELGEIQIKKLTDS